MSCLIRQAIHQISSAQLSSFIHSFIHRLISRTSIRSFVPSFLLSFSHSRTTASPRWNVETRFLPLPPPLEVAFSNRSAFVSQRGRGGGGW